jgi:hypothetical protein
MRTVYVAVDEDGEEYIYSSKPYRHYDMWVTDSPKEESCFNLPSGTIEKLVGREITWKDEPVRITIKLLENDKTRTKHQG